MTKVRSHREKQTNQCARKTQRPKAFRSEKKVICKNVARESDFRRTGLDPACPFRASAVCLHQCREGCGKMKLGRWAGPSSSGPWTPCEGVKREREVRKKLKTQIHCSDYFGFKRQWSKPKREFIGLCNWKVQRVNNIIKISFLFLHLPHPLSCVGFRLLQTLSTCWLLATPALQ